MRRVEREETDLTGAQNDHALRRHDPPRESDRVDRVRERLDERARARVEPIG